MIDFHSVYDEKILQVDSWDSIAAQTAEGMKV